VSNESGGYYRNVRQIGCYDVQATLSKKSVDSTGRMASWLCCPNSFNLHHCWFDWFVIGVINRWFGI